MVKRLYTGLSKADVDVQIELVKLELRTNYIRNEKHQYGRVRTLFLTQKITMEINGVKLSEKQRAVGMKLNEKEVKDLITAGVIEDPHPRFKRPEIKNFNNQKPK